MIKENLLISLVQSDLIWENPKKNRALFSEKLSQIKNTDIIILPEMFTTGFSMNVENLAEPRQGETLTWLLAEAKKANALILGTFMTKEKGKYFNTAVWVEPNGDFAFYDKRHLFRMAKENQTYSAGQNLLIKEYLGWRICPLICYDLRFPIWSRNKLKLKENRQTEEGYDLLIYMANWPKARISAWDTLLKARAIENLVYVAGVNRIGQDGNQVAYSGHSVLINPKGETVVDAKIQSCIHTAMINYAEMVNFRRKFPAYLDADY
jgi:predicted amidohydrolase